jgi:hypothetical protein
MPAALPGLYPLQEPQPGPVTHLGAEEEHRITYSGGPRNCADGIVSVVQV